MIAFYIAQQYNQLSESDMNIHIAFELFLLSPRFGKDIRIVPYNFAETKRNAVTFCSRISFL